MKPNTIYCADSIDLMNSWPEASVDLAFADPPFNIGYVYDKYHDDMPDEEYVQWSKNWIAAVTRLLKPDGSFYIAIGDEFAADIRVIGRELGLHLRNWIIWQYSFGQNTRTKFTRSHTHIFYFTKDPKQFTFNDDLLRFPSARHTEYQDLRANPKGRLPSDVWDEFPRVCGTFAERAGFHGCQMPEALLQRIVMASSHPGDLVIDPFIGSGTTAVAAKRLGRQYVGIDLSEEYATHTRQRLETVPALREEQVQAGDWPQLHTDMLLQIFRETKVCLHNLLPNKVAMRVIANSLSTRTNTTYTEDDVAQKLSSIPKAQLPKLPNDKPFVKLKHVTTEGKRYDRKIERYRGRKTTTKSRVAS